MKPPEIDRLRHMLDAARDARSFLRERRREDLDDDRQLTLSLVKCIEIIGEAATKLSPDLRDRGPEIPWPDIIGMRHRLIHMYYDVNLDVVWRPVNEELPGLERDLEALIAREGGTEPR